MPTRRVAVAREARPREVHVAAARGVRAVGFDRRLVVELAEQVRRGGPLGDHDRAGEAAAVVDGVAIGSVGIDVSGDPLVAERLLRAGGVVARFGAHEHAAVGVPRGDWIAGARRSNPGQLAQGRRVARISRDQRADEGFARVLGAVVAEPDGAGRDWRSVVVIAVVERSAVIVRGSDHDPAVARIDREGGFVLAPSGARAFVERVVGVMRKPGDVVGAHVAAVREVVREPNVDAWRRRQHGRRAKSERGTKGRQDAEARCAVTKAGHWGPPARRDSSP